jgi:hypothetical protein
MMDDQKKKRFLWGVALAWTPPVLVFAPTFLSLLIATFRISQRKATGLGVLAGGLAEAFATFGFVTVIVFEVGGIILLGRSFSRENRGRSALAVLSICVSGTVLLILGLLVWLFFFHMRHMS